LVIAWRTAADRAKVRARHDGEERQTMKGLLT
jgi:hypothetical protein